MQNGFFLRPDFVNRAFSASFVKTKAPETSFLILPVTRSGTGEPKSRLRRGDGEEAGCRNPGAEGEAEAEAGARGVGTG